MDLQQAKNLIQVTFNDSFDRTKFIRFIKELLNEVDEGKAQSWNKQYVKHAFHDGVKQYERIGTYTAPEGEKIDILIVYLEKETTLERARTLQRNFAAYHLKTRAEKNAGLVAFVSPNADNWRFSLVKMDYSLEKNEDGKGQVHEEITPSKRFSFIVGKNENSHTAQKQLLPILKEDKYNPTFKEIEEAFNIETVTKEFFNRYTELYFQFKEHLDALLKKDEKVRKDFTEKEISTVDFAKKTLGQIVFLYFLQKKGWFGVAPDKKWGEGPKNFLKVLFNRRDKYGDNFFNDVLEPLFYEALAQDRGVEAIYPRLNNCRMPFLNGGLFEPIRNYSWETTDIVIPDELFSNDYKDPKTGDIGSGILDVFDRYNFTVKENDPLEKEVAVDPEMLGKVFENLLEIKDRKSKGAFYTPREIVHYMCQESLINYLESETNNEIPRADLEFFIQKGDRIIENDKLAFARKIEREKKYNREYKDKYYSLLLPVSVRTNADKLAKLLMDIKVADPAVGSGAFPLGMINEIVRARKVLNIYKQDEISDYELKKHTITHSIYGVDIDPGAVDIAKLRLWLALVVDEETPHPLPNLEHKIMQGNSLISEYEGIKLFDERIFDEEGSKGAEQMQLGLGKSGAELKMEALQNKIATFVNEAQRSKKQNLKNEIDDLRWELIEETLKEQGKDDKLQEVKNLRHKNIKPFFIWKLEFSDVFKAKGGFDVVIGNPPYIQLQKNGGELANMFEACGYESFARTGDIYCLFYELGNQLLHNRGHLAFITSNKWMRAGYGERMRNYLANNTTPKSLIDLGPCVFETATVDTNILLFQKVKREMRCLACSVKENQQKNKIPLADYIEKNRVELSKFTNEAWTILDPVAMRIKQKIEKIGTPLKDWDIKINRGVLTGYNEAFIIDEKKKNELIAKDPKSAEILKPILRGKDIYRYGTDFADLWLITAHNGYKKENGEIIKPIDIDNYPAIKEWLNSHWEKISKRGDKGVTPYNLRNCAYQEEFEKEKIIYNDITQRLSFALAKPNEYFNNTVYFIADNPSLYFQLSILNSRTIDWYYKQISAQLGAKAVRMFSIYMYLLPIPEITSEEQQPFIALVNQILEITSAEDYDPKNPPSEQKEIESEIDKMVYELYGLTDEEIQIIEEKA